MPTTRDYLIATLMGENNRGTPESQQGVLDTIINRQADPGQYGARRGASVQDIVLARTPNGGYQYDAWRPELNGRPNGQYALSSAALQGRDALSGAAQRQYDQAAQVVDSFLNDGVGRGITQGSTFYQTSNAPNPWQRNHLWPRFGQITVGDHVYSGPGLVADRAEFERRNPDLFTSQQAPAFQQDGFGVIFNPSQGYDAGGSGSLGGLTGLFETLPYGTSPNGGPGDFLGSGDGNFDLGGAYPNQAVDPYAFGGTYNVGGGDPGSFGGFTGTMETGGGRGFTGMNAGGGVGLGSFGSGITQPGPAPDPYGFTGMNPSQGVGPGTLGQLPAGFDPAAYLAQNRDVAAAGIDAATHWRNFGAAEGRALGPAGWTPTQGPSGTAPTLGGGSTAPTIGPNGTLSTLPFGFDPAQYAAANPDLARAGVDPLQHYLTSGFREARAIAPGGALQSIGPDGLTRIHNGDGSVAQVLGAPGGSPTFGPGTTAPTYGPDGSVNVMSTGLTPTQGPPGLTSTIGPGGTVPSFSPGQDSSFLTMPSTSATTLGPPDAGGGLPPGFDPVSYVNANADLKALGFTGQQATDHFRNFGQFEARALAPGMEARVYAPPGTTPTQGPGPLTPTLDTASFAPTLGPPDLTPTQGPPGLTGTYGPPATTPTIGAGSTVPSWSPFGGGGISNGFGFTGLNAGQGLGAGPQSFGSLWPVGTGGGEPAPAAGGGGDAAPGPFDFSSANVGGFDVSGLGGGGAGGNAGGGPSGVNEMGISGGFDSEGAMRRVLEQQAADIRKADQAAKTPMHSDPNAFNTALANGGNTVGMGTALQTPGAIGGPVVPNRTVQNLGMGAPGAMFNMFAPWR